MFVIAIDVARLPTLSLSLSLSRVEFTVIVKLISMSSNEIRKYIYSNWIRRIIFCCLMLFDVCAWELCTRCLFFLYTWVDQCVWGYFCFFFSSIVMMILELFFMIFFCFLFWNIFHVFLMLFGRDRSIVWFHR